MSGLCGWFGWNGMEADRPDIVAMAEPLTRFDATMIRSQASGWAGLATATKSEHSLAQNAECMAAVHGGARFTEAALAEVSNRRGPAFALLEGYGRLGSGVLEVLEGSFAIALLDHRRGKALLAVDRLGVHPLYYMITEGLLIFGSSLTAITGSLGARPPISHQAIYDYVHFHVVPGPETIYVGCRRLPPGTFVVWDGTRAGEAKYWEMQFVEDQRKPFAELKETFLSLLRRCVSDAAKDGGVGAFLSGGTDSSTVVGMLREVTGVAPRSYSIGFDVQGFDEINYARIAARHFGTEHHEHYVTPSDVVVAIPRVAAIHDEPFGNASAVPTYYCAKLAREDGIQTLLGGDGGDELFGGNARYVTQYLYSLYVDLPPLLRNALIEPAVYALPEAGLIGKIQRYISCAKQAMPTRYDNYNLLERFGADQVFDAEFLSAVDRRHPRAQSREFYNQVQAQSLINRMLGYDLKYTLADNDLPKVMRSCELAGVGARFPMLDDSLVAFSARLAPELKLKGTRLRYFFKEALRGFLPSEIIAKKKHGFGLPFGTWLKHNRPLNELALDSLVRLKTRKIIRPQFIDRLMSAHIKEHAEYFGTMVWVLMMLEQWFQQHRATE